MKKKKIIIKDTPILFVDDVEIIPLDGRIKFDIKPRHDLSDWEGRDPSKDTITTQCTGCGRELPMESKNGVTVVWPCLECAGGK